jgi:uncharacterized protein (DUF433 family)
LPVLGKFRNNGVMNKHTLITADPNVMTGMPCVKGTRVTVSNVVRQVASGRTIGEICQDYPYLTEEGIRAALAFAADIVSGETHDLLAS